ncbi:preprotein translocase subunit SecD [Halorarius halobius]|uniref:preprotein translocase subunit SecD n=1 Tax=Halorarius halobius TaxID=2962671 RepID=UPI0020CDBD0F|nr:preprotein translocase subunit SecD [Halorarius halobius]
MTSLRDNWRIILLVVLVVASTVALFAPVAGSSDGSGGGTVAGDSPTNLEYGLELSGGTRIRAPLVGTTAEGVDYTDRDLGEIQRTVATELNLSLSEVQTRPQERALEIYTTNRTDEEFRAALQAANLSAGEIRDGVTAPTRQTAVSVLNDKINRGGLTGGSATIARSPTGETFILVEVPNANRSDVIELIGDRGVVSIVAGYPTEAGGNYTRTTVLEREDIAQVGSATEGQGERPPFVPVTLEQDSARSFAEDMRQYGFTSDSGVENCRWRQDEQDYGYCLFTVVDGQVVYASSMGSDLARIIESGEFPQDPAFRMITSNISEARELQINLRAGALPTTLDIQGEGTTYYLQPSLAQEFKLFSLITGAVAVGAVAAVVFIRYREPGVALPMVVTAAAEVYLLLGFAAAVGLALDLSHIAGFIAVIGTGVDDLVIIADEILQGDEIRTGKVFESRFRKAFWVIGAAAATTIIAMSPLAVLSLGDLQGFAIVTIVGVLLGVLVTRPAYGNILRNVVLD